MKGIVVVASAFVLAAALSACSATSAPTAGSEAPLWISASSPAIGSALSRGKTVAVSLTFTSSVAYPGRLTLSAQDQTGASLVAASQPPSIDIAGRGETRVDVSFAVPSGAASIRIIATFRPTEKNRPLTLIFADYSAG